MSSWFCCHAISRLFYSEPSYELLSKKDDDLRATEREKVQKWIESYPLNPHLSELKKEEINQYVLQLLKGLNHISINQDNIEMISTHLYEIAKLSDRARKRLLSTYQIVKCDKDCSFHIFSSLALAFSHQA